MIRSASRTLARQSLPTFRAARTQRFLSTAPPAQRSRSWKNNAVRWGLAIGGFYYYNTSNVFADEPACKQVWFPFNTIYTHGLQTQYRPPPPKLTTLLSKPSNPYPPPVNPNLHLPISPSTPLHPPKPQPPPSTPDNWKKPKKKPPKKALSTKKPAK